MKKALIITSTGGFLPQFLSGDVRVLKEMGYEIHYASNFKHNVYRFDPEALRREGIVLHPVDLNKKPWHLIKNAEALKRLTDIVKNEDIDLIHGHNPVGGMLARLSGRRSGKKNIKVIYTAHGFHFFKGAPLSYWLLFYPAERWLARHTDVIITINREDLERAERFRLKKGGSARQIHGTGLDTQRFRSRPEERERMRQALDIPDGAFHLVTAAELNANKNQRTVIEAIAAMKDNSSVYYSICGKGEMRHALEELIEEKGLSDRVRLLGYRTDMEMVLQSADCFVFPSYREGFGMAAVEALATGIPVIASDNRGTREYMKPGENGLVCPAGDTAAFRDAIERLMKDELLRKRMAESAVKSAVCFSKEANLESMREIYKEAL